MRIDLKQPLSLYWKCQLIGWSLAAAYWQFDGMLVGGYDPVLGAVQLITDLIMYILLTHGYRTLALRWKWTSLKLDRLVYRIAGAVLLMGFAFCILTLTKLYILRLLFDQTHGQQWDDFFAQNFRSVLVGGIRIMGIWLLAYHLYHYAKGQIELAKLNASLELLSRQAQLDSLSSQINPHFLFNSLNTIKFLILEDPDRARRGIDLLAELLRAGLYSGEGTMTSLRQELAIVKDYLELEALRFEERLSVHFQIDENLLDCTLPHFAIQTLVENAIKHGIATQKNGGEIAITVTKEVDAIAVTVKNPGQLHDNQGLGIGLNNLKERLSLIYGMAANFQIRASPDRKLVHAIILIPIS